jgi:DNA-directed RNA polymerase subunit RPC12/RpoP
MFHYGGWFSLNVSCQICHCDHCGHDNEDLTEDEDGDLVCEECGHVIEVCLFRGVSMWRGYLDAVWVLATRSTTLTSFDCSYNVFFFRLKQTKKEVVHTCAHCGHENMNLERDEDGDLVCEECGHVIPEENTMVVAEVRLGDDSTVP